MIRLMIMAFLIIPQLCRAEISHEDRLFFEAKIRPLLAEACYKCHAVDSKKVKGGLLLDSKWGWMQGGDSGQVIIPGKIQESLLIKVIHRNPDYEAMPPKTVLNQQQIKDLEEWIHRGAPDPRPKKERTKKDKHHYNLAERKNWWSLQKITTPTVPQVKNNKWPKNSIDAFILKKLEDKQWSPAAQADKLTLLRRLSYDLSGLPPTIDQQHAFEKDKSHNAYEKVVDGLLNSPRFGEHWARKWMDLMRYAESKAFEFDYTMPYVWRYRDYLIKAFNNDVPYNELVLESLAGDLLKEPRIDANSGENESIKGPGFYYLNAGHHGPPDIH
ncbi:MAG: DUF1549 domain-containing protein, partial [Lentisphaeraceae bacterium]|nr:DUF1549 domain-containing protein [Lentisphaeraceae bacterium]